MDLPPEEKEMLNLFAGPGGTEVGLNYAGWYSTDAVEYDAAACKTLKKAFAPRMKVHEGDIRLIPVANYRRRYYRLAVYTNPCDHYSSFANVHGKQTGDDLYLHALRNHVLLWPEVVLIENVVGMRKFEPVMELWRNIAHYYTTELTVWGHDFTMQRKTRVFLILHRQPFDFPMLKEIHTFVNEHRDEIPFQSVLARPGRILRDYLDAPEEKVIDVQPYIETRLDGEYRDRPIIYSPDQADPINLMTNYKRDRSNFLVEDADSPIGSRPFSVNEIARLHGFPVDANNRVIHQFCGNKNQRYGQVVDTVMPIVAYALGTAINAYFEAIPALAPQPKPKGYRFIKSPSPQRRKVDEASEMTNVPDHRATPLPKDVQQLALM
jgi:DNA (cytosine-5)-methyltransferase 1